MLRSYAWGIPAEVIDAVFTWVDGGDPEHARQRARYRGDVDVDDGAHRYRDGDELRFALRALHEHAPWIRRLFLVTSGQRPRWLDAEAPGLTLVTHQQIFVDPAHLPTFNSCAIEMHLDRIPGLSERFVYFNDDFFLGRAVGPDDFLCRDGQWLRLTPAVVPAVGAPVPPTLAPIHLASLQHTGAVLDDGGPPRPRRFVPHVPLLVERRVWEAFAARHGGAVALTAGHRFRAADDLAFPFAYTHFRLALGLAGDRTREVPEVVIPYSVQAPTFARLLDQVWRERPPFFCLQDESGHDDTKASLARRLLETLYPRPSRFEISSVA